MNSPPKHWHRQLALESVGGDAEFLSELAGIFCAAGPTLLKSLGKSIAAQNLDSAADAAHLLRSVAGSITALAVVKAALAVEMMARQGELDDMSKAYDALQQEARLLVDEIADFRAGLNAPVYDLYEW